MQRQTTESAAPQPQKEKHGAAAGLRPERADWTIDQNWEGYTQEEHAVWKTLFERQTKLLPGRACKEFVQGMGDLPIGADQIPDFRRLSDVLMKHTGWQVVAVPSLVPDEVFFEHLANRRFPAGQFLRKPNELDYLEEPDVFHDVFGHVPMLTDPVFADYMQAYGEGGLRAEGLGRLENLARLYWYTVEFGLLQTAEGLRIYGAGIVSSHAESIFALDDPSPNRLVFDLERVMRTPYRIDDFQQVYFVVLSLETLLAATQEDFAPIYARLQGASDIAIEAITPQDRVVTRGTQAYAAVHGRRAPQ